MRKIKLEVLKKETITDDEGNFKEEFIKVKDIFSDYLMPYGSEKALKEYGFTINTTNKTITFDKVNQKEYVRYENKTYFIIEVMNYPNGANILLLELI